MSYTNGLDKPSDYFNTVTYTGDGSSPRSITGVGFQPDLNWTKSRSLGGSHVLANSVSGANKQLVSNLTNAEATNGIYGYLSAFDSDGWTMLTGSTDMSRMNANSTTYVSWNWLAGGTASSNTNGDITSSVSASTTSGFSIVSYTGTGSAVQIGHGLNSAPEITIIKRRNATTDWVVYTDLIDGSFDYLFLNTTAAKANTTTFSSDSDTFNFSASSSVANISGAATIAYCFHSVKGYSKMGSYTGNGSTDGTFVYTGFKPAFVMVKRTNVASSWVILDNKRDAYNVADAYLLADSSGAENTASTLQADFLSNGFKQRGTGVATNSSGDNYIYMCFAENPFTTSTGVPCTAR